MNNLLVRIQYDKRTERNRLERAALLVVMGHVTRIPDEAGYRVYHVRSQSGNGFYKVYVGDNVYPTCTCWDWGLNDWGDAYLGIPMPTYRCKHGLACLIKEAQNV